MSLSVFSGKMIIVVLLGLLSACDPRSGAMGSGALLQGNGILGSAGDIVRGYAANSRLMIDIRTKIADVVGKLNLLTMRRKSDFQKTEKVKRVEAWMDSITQRVFNISLKRAEACMEEFRHDLSVVRAIRQLCLGATVSHAWGIVYNEMQAYEVLYKAMAPAIWIEFINYRAAAVAAMLTGLQYSLESLGARKEALQKIRDNLTAVATDAPT